ncbi:MAG: thioredoxin [bacterium]
MIIEVTKENFEEVLKKEKLVLDFWAPWCGPCRAIAPNLEEVVAKNDNVVIGKVNVDNDPELAEKYQVRNIPTLVYLNKGEMKEKTVGLKSAEEILSIVETI